MNAIKKFIWKRRVQFWKRKMDQAERMAVLHPFMIKQYETTLKVYQELFGYD